MAYLAPHNTPRRRCFCSGSQLSQNFMPGTSTTGCKLPHQIATHIVFFSGGAHFGPRSQADDRSTKAFSSPNFLPSYELGCLSVVSLCLPGSSLAAVFVREGLSTVLSNLLCGPYPLSVYMALGFTSYDHRIHGQDMAGYPDGVEFPIALRGCGYSA